MKIGKLLTAIMLPVLMFLWTLPVAAQINRGVLQGIVTDPQGGVVPGVDVTVTSVDTNIATLTKTNATGYYRVGNLIPGKYRARFELAGFSMLEMTDVEIIAGTETRLDAQLKVSATRQTIQVAAQVPLVETAASNSTETLGSQLATDIPLAGRDLLQLAFLIPGTNTASGPPGSNFGFNSAYGSFPDPTGVASSDIEVNGGSGGMNAWYLDGNPDISPMSDNPAITPSPDAVQEFQLITNNLAAEYGHTGGGVFNEVLKSGTNAFHGDLYEYVRNNVTNARNPFTSIDSFGHIIPDRRLRYNDFGGTLGGPVILPGLYNGRDKTFFFFSFDASILHLFGSQVFTVPTALMRTGDFSEVPNITQHGLWNPYSTRGPDENGAYARSAFGTAITPNGCTGSIVGGLAVNPTTATCNFSAQIPATIATPNGNLPGLNPIAQFYTNSYPLPNFNSPLSSCPMGKTGYLICDNYLGTVGSSQDPKNISVKIDHQWSQRSKYVVEWLSNPNQYRNYRAPWTGPTYPDDFVGYNSTYPLNFTNMVVGVGNTFALGPTLINEFRVNYTRQVEATVQGTLSKLMDYPATEQMTAPLNLPTSTYYPVPDFGIISPGGGVLEIGPQGYANQTNIMDAFTVTDDLIKVAGKHTLKTGIIYRLEHGDNKWGGPTQLGFYGSLASNPITGQGGGSGLSEFLMGAEPQYENGTASGPAYYDHWSYWAAYLQDEFRVSSRLTLNVGLRWDVYGIANTNFNPTTSNFCLNCPNPLTGLNGKVIYSGDPELPKGSAVLPRNYTDFAPRVNFSWAPFGDQKTVIRGGYNMIYTDALNAMNWPGWGIGGSLPGWFVSTDWAASYYPSQCPSYSGHCVAFPLSDTSDKASLATPPFPSKYPAQNHDPLLGSYLYNYVKPSRDPMLQVWNVQIQRALPSDMMVSIGYVGNLGTHMLVPSRNWDYIHPSDVIKYKQSINAVVPITDYYSGTAAATLASIYGSDSLPRSLLLQTYPDFSGIDQEQSYDGTGVYDAMDLKVEKRFSHGLNFIAAYTVSKDIQTPPLGQAFGMMADPVHRKSGNIGGRAGAVSGIIYGTGVQNIDDRRGDRALAPIDTPQMFNLAGSYRLPFGVGQAFLNRPGVANAVLGGWRFSETFNVQSGLPLSISGPCDQITCRPDLVGNPSFSGSRTKAQRIQQWINPAAFQPVFGNDQTFWANYDPSDPRAYLWGTAGAELPNFRAPGFWNMDAALVKHFRITESKALEVRWETFNVLNHMNLAYPNTGYCLPPGPNGETDAVRSASCSFGRITNIQNDPRSMQFSMKLLF